MPRKPNPLTAQIKALTAMVKADRAEQREAERPVLAARRALSEPLRRAVRSVDYHNQQISDELFKKGAGSLFFNCYKLADAERNLVEATKAFKSRLADLMAFDLANNIDGAEYPQLPTLDRDATIAAGKADHERTMADIRARIQRDARPAAPRRNPLDALFGDMPEPIYRQPRLR